MIKNLLLLKEESDFTFVQYQDADSFYESNKKIAYRTNHVEWRNLSNNDKLSTLEIAHLNDFIAEIKLKNSLLRTFISAQQVYYDTKKTN